MLMVLNGQNHGFNGVEHEQLQLLRQILEMTSRKIVLSSTWGLNSDSNRSLRGIFKVVIGETQYLKKYSRNCCNERVQEIGRYLESDQFLDKYEVTS